jgi:hypothetical protein
MKNLPKVLYEVDPPDHTRKKGLKIVSPIGVSPTPPSTPQPLFVPSQPITVSPIQTPNYFPLPSSSPQQIVNLTRQQPTPTNAHRIPLSLTPLDVQQLEYLNLTRKIHVPNQHIEIKLIGQNPLIANPDTPHPTTTKTSEKRIIDPKSPISVRLKTN